MCFARAALVPRSLHHLRLGTLGPPSHKGTRRPPAGGVRARGLSARLGWDARLGDLLVWKMVAETVEHRLHGGTPGFQRVTCLLKNCSDRVSGP